MSKKKSVVMPNATDGCLISDPSSDPHETYYDNRKAHLEAVLRDTWDQIAALEKAPESLKNLSREKARALGIWF